jgi:hypothetical protein
MNVPNYISTLLQPTASKPTGRRVWSIDLETVWVPFFLATNAVKATNIPSDALGAPLRLNYDKDGEVRFTKSGRPSMKVAPELAAQVRIVRENLVANLQSFTGKVMSQEKDAYKAQVEAAQQAAQPIGQKMNEDLELAYIRLQEREDSETEVPTESTREAAPVAA